MNKKFVDGQVVFIKPKSWFLKSYLQNCSYELTHRLSKIYPFGWSEYMNSLFEKPMEILQASDNPHLFNSVKQHYYIVSEIGDTSKTWAILEEDLTISLKDLE